MNTLTPPANSGAVTTPTPASTAATTPVITPASIKQPQSPISVPQTPPSTGAAGVQGFVDSSMASLSRNADQAKQTQDQSLSALITALSGDGKTAITDQANQTTGVSQFSNALDDTNQKILAEKQSLNNRIDALRKNTSGMSEGALNQEIQRATDASSLTQANYAVTQSAQMGDFSKAKAIADRAVALQTEQQQSRITALQAIYENAKGQFTTAEQQQFQAAQQQRQQALDQQTFKLKADYDEQIKMHDPLYQAQVQEARANAAKTTASIGDQSTTLNGKPQTATQSSVQGYADRMAQAEQSISKLGSQFTGSLALGGILPNQLQSGDRQMYEQAKRNFVNAVLRQESGAAISSSEFTNAEKQYFPAAGDSPETVAQKAANRNTAINNFYRQSNVARPVSPGDIITGNDGKQYKVGDDGQTITPI